MSNNTKIMLSPRELAIVNDAEFILTKHKIIQQVFALFQQQVPLIQQQFQSIWRELVLADGFPKISKGEQYRGLPYVVMDYPAVFDKHDRFAVRTIFCWADAFSVTVHLRGKYKELLKDRMVKYIITHLNLPLYVGVNEKEWEHHFEEDNYLPLQQFKETELATQFDALPHIKIALRYPLAQWNEMVQHLQEAYVMIASLTKEED